MPIPTFTQLRPNPEFNDIVQKFNTIVQEMQNILLTLDSLNVVSLNAGTVIVYDLDGGPGTITLTKDGMIINNGTRDTFTVDINGNVTMTGALVRSAEGYPRVELNSTSNLIGAYQDTDSYLAIRPDAFGSSPGFVFNDNTKTALIYLLTGISDVLSIITPSGQAGISVSSGKDLSLSCNASSGYVISVNSWTNFVNRATGHTLQQDLNSLAPLDGPVFTSSATLPTNTTIGSLSPTELGYLTGLTANVQSQLNAKQSSLGYTAENTANKNAANGYAGLDSSGKVNPSQLPAIAITDTFVVASQAAMLALSAETGDVAVRTDLNKSYILKGTNPTVLADWQELLTPTSSVTTVFGRSGAVTAQSNDYTWAQVNKATSSLADITTRSASDLSSGTLPGARMPALTGAITSSAGSTTTTLASGIDATKIANGSVTNIEFQYLDGVTSALQTQIDGKASKTQEGWIAPTLQNSWVNFGGTVPPAGYYKDEFGQVRLRGFIKDGTATAATLLFTLPVGYRPAYSFYCPCVCNNGTADVFASYTVGADGTVRFNTGANVWFSLDSITFRAEQ